jgi:hypothetical protein
MILDVDQHLCKRVLVVQLKHCIWMTLQSNCQSLMADLQLWT